MQRLRRLAGSATGYQDRARKGCRAGAPEQLDRRVDAAQSILGGVAELIDRVDTVTVDESRRLRALVPTITELCERLASRCPLLARVTDHVHLMAELRRGTRARPVCNIPSREVNRPTGV